MGGGRGGQGRIIIALQGIVNGLLFGALLCPHLSATTSACLGAMVEKYKNNRAIKGEIENLFVTLMKIRNQTLRHCLRKWGICVSGAGGCYVMMIKMGMMVTGTMMAFMLQLYDCFAPQSYMPACCLVMHP